MKKLLALVPAAMLLLSVCSAVVAEEKKTLTFCGLYPVKQTMK